MSPRTEPCGTPLVTGDQEEKLPEEERTRCRQFDKKQRKLKGKENVEKNGENDGMTRLIKGLLDIYLQLTNVTIKECHASKCRSEHTCT